MANNTSNKQIKLILDLLKKGEEYLTFDTQHDAVLFLGNTGAGKSTFAHFFTGDNSNLESKEVGVGEYIIIDTNDKISNNSTITSKTIFPELLIDAKTNTVFYDCPGFSDTRSAAHDIAATYFTKKIIESNSSIKLIFVISYPSVRHGVDRQGFMLLVKHVTKVIKDIEKFKDSIALIITKVDNKFIKQGKIFNMVPDDDIIEEIASFIKGVKQELETNKGLEGISLQQQHFYKNAINLVDAILAQRGQDYIKIGLFRRPDEVGPLSEVPLLRDGKELLRKIIYENIQFTAHDEGDFSYSISSDSTLHVHELVEEIHKSIVSDIVNVGQEIREFYYAQEKQFHDIDKLYSIFKTGYDVLSGIMKATTEFVEPPEFIKQIIKNLNNLNISISSKNLLSVLKYDQYLQFLHSVSDDETPGLIEWDQGLRYITESLDNSHKWYGFLKHLHIMLSTYDIQRDVPKYNITRLKAQINASKKRGVTIANIDFFKFLDQDNKQAYDMVYHNAKNITLDGFKLKALENVIDFTITRNINYLCLSNKLVVTGVYVKLSDVVNKTCPEKIKFMEIFALSKVFIDTTLNRTGDKLQLSIIAPTWDTIGSQKIILDGVPGQAHKIMRAPGTYGRHGIPGLPGGPAGNFFGFGHLFINNEHLSISAKGGNGGPGQHGGNGTSGKDGENPRPIGNLQYIANVASVASVSFFTQWKKNGFKYKEISASGTRCSLGTFFFIPAPVCHKWYTYRVYGKSCTYGRPGGNGGAGGKGGPSGDIIIITNQDKVLKILTDQSEGQTGALGGGGYGGKGGVTRSQKVRVRKEHGVIMEYSVDGPREIYRHCSSAKDGIAGYNSTGQKSETAVKLLNPSHTVNNYKNYLIENLSVSITESLLKKFHYQLQSNQAVVELYDTSGFINELQGLENKYYQIHREMPLDHILPFYKSLLHRISQYADSPKDHERSMGFKKALAYSYTATLSKICSINNNLGNNLVIDLNGYFDLVINNINKLKDLRTIVAINEYQKMYQDVIDAKIDEAERLINTQITPEISNIFSQIDNQIQSLIDETITLQNEATAEKRKLMEEQGKLEYSSVIRKYLGIVKIASLFLNFLGSMGTAIGRAIQEGVGVVESLMLDDTSVHGNNTLAPLSSGVNNFITTITNELKSKQQVFKIQLDDVEQELDKFLIKQSSNNIIYIKKIISTTKQSVELEIEKFDPAFVNKLHTMRKEIVQLLQNNIEKLKTYSDQGKEELGVIKHSQNILRIFDMSLDVIEGIRNNQTKIDVLGDALKEQNMRLAQLEQFEENIYKIILPMCRDMEDKVTTMAKKLEGKSHASLDVSKWKIQSAIKDVKFQIKEMTQGFSAEKELTHYIGKLEEGMSIIINVYDRVQNYHDRTELAAYIADISSSNATEFEVRDIELNNSISNLTLIIKSNLILGQYESAMSAYKQYSFPFAHSYLAQFNLPTDLELSDNTNSLVSNAVTQIEQIKSKMTESADKHIRINVTFKSSQGSPFFIWRHDINKATISKLLEGQEVTMKADITKGINKNAIKFNVIGIRFKLANETMQKEFDKQLEDFEVTMTHLGNSYYRCGSQFYTIASDKQVIVYSSSYSEMSGDPLHTNLVYDKIKNNECILSPYAMWNIKLNSSNSNFDILAKYENDHIDLELEGHGQYIDQDIDVCNYNLKNYYQVDETLAEMNTINVYNQQGSIISRHHDRRHNESRCRRRRGITDEHISEDSFATSGTCSNFKSSLINNIFNFISNSIITLTYLNPVNKITQWLAKDQKSVYQDITDKPSMEMKLINIQLLAAESSPHVPNNFLDEDSFAKEGIDYTLLSKEGNLLLLDLLIRKNNGIKYNNNSVTINIIDNEYAHNLAYNAYVIGHVDDKTVQKIE